MVRALQAAGGSGGGRPIHPSTCAVPRPRCAEWYAGECRSGCSRRALSFWRCAAGRGEGLGFWVCSQPVKGQGQAGPPWWIRRRRRGYRAKRKSLERAAATSSYGGVRLEGVCDGAGSKRTTVGVRSSARAGARVCIRGAGAGLCPPVVRDVSRVRGQWRGSGCGGLGLKYTHPGGPALPPQLAIVAPRTCLRARRQPASTCLWLTCPALACICRLFLASP